MFIPKPEFAAKVPPGGLFDPLPITNVPPVIFLEPPEAIFIEVPPAVL